MAFFCLLPPSADREAQPTLHHKKLLPRYSRSPQEIHIYVHESMFSHSLTDPPAHTALDWRQLGEDPSLLVLLQGPRWPPSRLYSVFQSREFCCELFQIFCCYCFAVMLFPIGRKKKVGTAPSHEGSKVAFC